MRVAVLVEPGRIEMEERPIPSPAPGDVLVRVSAAGTVVATGDGVDPARIGAPFAHPVPGTVGRVDLDAMVTARFPLERAADALDSDRVPGTVKSVVTVS